MTDEFSGRLRARVMVERASGTAWLPLGSSWAALVPVEAVVAVVGEGRVSRPRYQVELRARADIALADRLRWQGRVLRILRFEPDPRSPEKLTLLAEEMG